MKSGMALACALCLALWAGAAGAQKLDLAPEEQAFIADHPVIRLSDVNRPPLSIVDKGRYDGILHDYYQKVAQLTGLEFRFTSVGDGVDAKALRSALEKRDIDMIGGAAKASGQSADALVSGPIFRFPMGLASLAQNPPESPAALKGQKIAAARDSLASAYARENLPGVNLLLAPSPAEALDMVAKGKAAAMLGDMAALPRIIAEAGLDGQNAKTSPAGDFEVYALSRADWPLLRSILDKALAAMPRQDRQALEDGWLRADAGESDGARLSLTPEERRYIKENPVFTASNEANWPPFNFNVNGRPQGYSVDYMNMLARKIGLKVRYVIGPEWDEFEHLLQQGNLDVLMNLAVNPKREAYTIFTPPYATMVHGIVYRDSEPSPPTMENLKGRVVAVPKGFYTETVLQTYYPDIKLLTPPDALGALQAVATGRADAAFGSIPAQNYLIRKNFLLNLQSRALVDNTHFPTVNLHFGVAKNRPMLARILTKAMATVSERQMSELRQKWLSADRMNRKYIPLTPSEQEVLSRMGVVRMCVRPDWMPFGRIDEQGKFTGMTADYVSLMAERIGVDLTLVPTRTWEESLDDLAKGKCDIIPAIAPTDENAKFVSFTRPYLEFPVVAATLQDALFVPDAASLAGKRVGAVGGQSWTEEILRDYPNVAVVKVKSVDEGLRMVRDREIYAFVDTMAAISYAIGRNRFTDLKIAGKLESGLSLAVGVNKDNPLLARIFDMAVASLSEEERRDIFANWISITFEHGFDYGLLWKILAAVAVILAAIFYWNRKLVRLNQAVTRANASLNLAHKKISTLLDNSGQGFLSFGADGVVEPELSRECERLFGKPAAGLRIADLLFPGAPEAGDNFSRNVVRILGQKDAFKKDLLLSLMPTRFSLGDKRVDAEYKPLEGERLMLVLTDVTDKCALEAEVERERKRLAMIVAAVRDKEDFFSVLDDYVRFIRARTLGAAPDGPNGADSADSADGPDGADSPDGVDGGFDLPSLYRHVHTFKGLFLQLEFIRTPEALHRLEAVLAQWQAAGKEMADPKSMASAFKENGCQEALDDDLRIIRAALGDVFFERGRHISAPSELIERLEDLARRLEAKAAQIGLGEKDLELLEKVRRLRLRDMRDMLAAYPESVRMLAERAGKIVAPFTVEGDAVEVTPQVYAPLVSSLVHVFRNAVVHGIEDPDQRLEAGKPEAGRVLCRVEDAGETLRVVIEDDGRGVDLDALRDKAAKMSLAFSGDADKDLNLIFERDMTTQKAADALSGRGVGLFAVMDKVKRLGGAARVASTKGKGTSFSFTLPKFSSGRTPRAS